MSAQAGDVDLSCLHKATISYDYLHTNSTTHEFLFGAIAELVDNSRDAGANNLYIDADSDKAHLSVLDDGCGMDRDEAISVVSFGHSLKKMEQGMIGQYGNGLKSGAMRIGNDFIMFTKKNGVLTCLLLSQTFHETSRLKDIFVPTPSFSEDRKMLSDNAHRHSVEMGIIYKYSPFSSQEELFAQFDKISGSSGTLIIVFNMRRIDTGELELELNADPNDIKLSKFEEQREEERNSLRAYLSVLYINPRMKIYLRGKKVNTIRILNTLLYPYRYKYMAKNLKSCAVKEYESCVRKKKDAEDMLAKANSEYGALMNTVNSTQTDYPTNKELRVKQRLLSMKVSERKELVAQCEKRVKAALQAKSSPAPLVFYYGLNIHHRNRYGCMIYNNGRLIEMYERPPVQKEKNDLMMKCLGVVGLVDVPYSVLEPTHNKQGFENHRERQALLRAMNDHMEQYWGDIGIGATPGGIKNFWKQFGYEDSLWSSSCSNQLADRVRRFQKTGHVVQCNTCLKWRHIEFQRNYMENGIPDDWTCDKHPNSAFRSCSRKEDEAKAKEGRLVPMKSPEPARSSFSNSSTQNNRIPVRTDVKRENGVRMSDSRDQSRTPFKLLPRRAAANQPIKKERAQMSSESSESEEDRPVRKRQSARNEVRPSRHSQSAPSKSRMSSGAPPHRQTGQPPMKRPTPSNRRVIVEDSDEEEEQSEEEEEEVVVRKPKTKADLRRRIESERDSSQSSVTAATAGTSHEGTAGRTNGFSASTSNSNGSVESAEQIRNRQLEKERDTAVKYCRQLLMAFANQGSKFAGELRTANDDALLATDAAQLTRNILEELVKKPTRELEQKRLRDFSFHENYPSMEALQTDMVAVIGWASQDVAGIPPVENNNVFSCLKSLAEILRNETAAAAAAAQSQE